MQTARVKIPSASYPASGDDPPISVPADRWDWAVAGWPHAWWVAWHRLVTELMPWGTTAEEIKLAQHRAYLEIKATMNQLAGGPSL